MNSCLEIYTGLRGLGRWSRTGWSRTGFSLSGVEFLLRATEVKRKQAEACSTSGEEIIAGRFLVRWIEGLRRSILHLSGLWQHRTRWRTENRCRIKCAGPALASATWATRRDYKNLRCRNIIFGLRIENRSACAWQCPADLQEPRTWSLDTALFRRRAKK